MNQLFINEGIFESHKSSVERGEFFYIYYRLNDKSIFQPIYHYQVVQ